MMNIGPAAKETALQLLMLIILKLLHPASRSRNFAEAGFAFSRNRPWEVFCDGAGDVFVFSFLCLSSGG